MNDTKKTVRYVLNKQTCRYLWDDPYFNGEKKEIPHFHNQPIFVNILARVDTSIKLKLFLPDGEVMEGWNLRFNNPVSISNMQLLFDGRFNA